MNRPPPRGQQLRATTFFKTLPTDITKKLYDKQKLNLFRKIRTITIDTVQHDVDKLIHNTLQTKNQRAAKFAKPILQSEEYHKFLDSTIYYIR